MCVYFLRKCDFCVFVPLPHFPSFCLWENSKWQKKCFFSGLGLLTWHFVLLGRHKSFQSWIMNVLTYTTLGKVHNVMYLKSFKNATNIFAIKISRKKIEKKSWNCFCVASSCYIHYGSTWKWSKVKFTMRECTYVWRLSGSSMYLYVRIFRRHVNLIKIDNKYTSPGMI